MSPGKEVHRSHDEHGDINVFDSGDTRTLCFGSNVEQSAMRLSDPALLLFGYTRSMMLATLLVARLRRALVLGLGGGSLARCLHTHFPTCRITAVEQRRKVARVARDWFALPIDDRLGVEICDAATYLAEPGKPMDLIFADLYDAEGMTEQQTDTRFFHQCKQRLADGGIAVFNHWSGRYFRDQQVNQALQEVFDGQVLRVNATGRNRIVFGFRTAIPALAEKAWCDRAQRLGERMGFPLLHDASRFWTLNRELLQREPSVPTGSPL